MMFRHFVCLLTAFAVLACAHAQESGVDDFLSGLGALEASHTGRAPHLQPGSAEHARAQQYTPDAIECQRERMALWAEVTYMPWTPPSIGGVTPPSQQSMQWHAQATTLLQRATVFLGPDHMETTLCRQLLAEVLIRQHRGDAAAPIWRQCIEWWERPENSEILGGGIESAHCERGLGLSLLQYPRASVAMPDELRCWEPIRPQISYAAHYSDQTREGIRLLRSATRLYDLLRNAPGHDVYPKRIRGECAAWKSAADAAALADRNRAYSSWYKDFRRRYLADARQQYLDVAEMFVATPPQGRCYHLPDCHLVTGRSAGPGRRAVIGDTLQLAVHRRDPCSVCQPPTIEDLEYLRTIEFDGKVLDVRTAK